MAEVGVHEAKTHFSKLLQRVERGEEITITRNRQVVARLVPPESLGPRIFGQDRGRVTIPDDFNDPLDAELLELFGA